MLSPERVLAALEQHPDLRDAVVARLLTKDRVLAAIEKDESLRAAVVALVVTPGQILVSLERDRSLRDQVASFVHPPEPPSFGPTYNDRLPPMPRSDVGPYVFDRSTCPVCGRPSHPHDCR